MARNAYSPSLSLAEAEAGMKSILDITVSSAPCHKPTWEAR